MNKVIYMATRPAMAAAARVNTPFVKEMGRDAGRAVVQAIAAQVAMAAFMGVGFVASKGFDAVRKKVRSARKTLATTIEPTPPRPTDLAEYASKLSIDDVFEALHNEVQSGVELTWSEHEAYIALSKARAAIAKARAEPIAIDPKTSHEAA